MDTTVLLSVRLLFRVLDFALRGRDCLLWLIDCFGWVYIVFSGGLLLLVWWMCVWFRVGGCVLLVGGVGFVVLVWDLIVVVDCGLTRLLLVVQLVIIVV